MCKAKQLLSVSSGFIIAGLMVSIYAYTDKFMLKQMLDEAAAGYYSLAFSLSTFWEFILVAVMDSMYPSIIDAYNVDRERFDRKNRQLYAMVIYISLTASILICIFGRLIVQILYGAEYLPTVQPLRIVVWYTTFSYLGAARNAWVVSENKQKYLKYLYAAAAIINVVLNLVLIPLWGVSGAALASLVTQISTTVILPAFIPALRPNARLMVEALMLKNVFKKE